ncbi:Uma2 family endonuclease [Thiotrichales bacterium HSG1]|nr:Uma2 family endonuclease [Thiotrichales bacterium HSG1]
MEWQQVIENPFLQNLPFKIELNKWGKILMSPASNNHGRWQFEIGTLIKQKKQSGTIITECSIQTSDGVKVADVAWLSDKFVEKYGFITPYDIAPEICVEITSSSNSKEEMNEKIKLYFNQGAKEVWLCNQKGEISYYFNQIKRTD